MKKVNFARNFQEGIFKLCELSMDISAIEHAFIDSKAQWFSADQNTAKQRFFFTENGESRSLNTVSFMRVVYEFPDHNSEWQMIDWPITDPDRGMVEMIIPDQILTVGTTEMLQHVYLIQPHDFLDGGGDIPIWEDWKTEFGVIKPYTRFNTQEKWTDVGVVHSMVNLSFVDRDLEPMREFYITRFEDITREIYAIRDRVMEVIGEVDVDSIVAAAIDEFLMTNSMPTVDHMNQIHLQILSHVVDNIRHLNPEDRSNINSAMLHIENEDVHISPEDREGLWDGAYHARDSNPHISPEEREMLHRLSEMDPEGPITIELTMDQVLGLNDEISSLHDQITNLQIQIDMLNERITM